MFLSLWLRARVPTTLSLQAARKVEREALESKRAEEQVPLEPLFATPVPRAHFSTPDYTPQQWLSFLKLYELVQLCAAALHSITALYHCPLAPW